MPNTLSTKKSLRQSERKKKHNLFWKRRIKNTSRDLKKLLSEKDSDVAIIRDKEVLLQKYLDKASKNNVIHKNKANRIKSKYAQRITAYKERTQSKEKSTTGSKKNKSPKK